MTIGGSSRQGSKERPNASGTGRAMRVLLDTTYLLPLAGISVEGVEKNALRLIRERGHELFISEVSLFEMLAKGAKLAADRHVDEDRISLAIRSILQDQRISRITPYQDGVIKSAVWLRRYHSDFIDCLILASALEVCDILVTEDERLSRNEGVTDIISQTKPNFTFSTHKRLLSD